MASNPNLMDLLTYEAARQPVLGMRIWADSVQTVRVVGMTRQGHINFQHRYAAGDGTQESASHPIDDYPVLLTAYTYAGPNHSGRCYMRLDLNFGGLLNFRMFSGYLSYGKYLSWPPGAHQGFQEGPGYKIPITGTDPAANVEISETVPTNFHWEVESIRFTLITDANVADRTVHLKLTDGTDTLFQMPAGVVQPASVTRVYEWHAGYLVAETAFDVAGIIRMRLPDIFKDLPQAYVISTATTNRQATDNFGAPIITVRRRLNE